jgi:hypothetical protein
VRSIDELKNIFNDSSTTECADLILQNLTGYRYRNNSEHRDDDVKSLASALIVFARVS